MELILFNDNLDRVYYVVTVWEYLVWEHLIVLHLIIK